MHFEVIGDLATSIERLTKVVGKLSFDKTFFSKVQQEAILHLKEGSEDSRYPVIPQRLVSDVRKAMGEDGIIALDNGMYKI